MATTLKYGSSGDEVRKLQETLNATGKYNLATDGKFGPKTQEAVKAYQKANGLSVDGIVGTNTWGALNKASAPSATTTAKSTPSATTTPSATQATTTSGFKYTEPQEYDIVKEAQAKLEQLGSKPVVGQSQWMNGLQETIDKIMNREKFSYDLNGDALYQQYKDQYTTQGKMAMMDTMGQAAALTGGYGNSYASTAGNQAYQGYLQQLNDRVPELYQLALDKYNQEGQDLLNQYALLNEQDSKQYEKDRDAISDWYTDRDYLTNRADTAYNQAYNDQTFKYGIYADDLNNQWKQKEFDEAVRQFGIEDAYRRERDAVSDAQWEKSYNLSAKSASGATKEILTNQGYSVNDAEKIADRMAGYVMDGDEDGAYAFLLSLDTGNAALNAKIFQQYFGHEYDEGIDTDVPPLSPAAAGGGSDPSRRQKHLLN